MNTIPYVKPSEFDHHNA